MRFRTKVDFWLVAVLGAAMLLPITLGVFGGMREGIASPLTWSPLVIAALAAVVVVVVAVPTCYEVQSDRLLIRSGVLHWEVPLGAISAIVPSSNPVSGPAWSLDRLEVQWVQAGKTRRILISPLRPADFLKEIALRDAGLIRDGHGLRRMQ